MSTAVLELPQNLDLQEGESFSMEIEGVAHLGKLIVQRMHMRQLPSPKAESVKDFLHFCKTLNQNGVPAPTDDQLDEMRWQALKEKHLK